MTQGASQPPARRKTRLLLLLTVVILAAGGAACWYRLALDEDGVVAAFWRALGRDPSVVVKSGEGDHQFGSAYDRAYLDAGGYKVVVLPADAEVLRTSGSRIEIYLWKAFAAHKGANIRRGRVRMGCCRKAEGDRLLLSTFGWFKSFEGGTT
jgi:hypothetical protein